MLSTLALAQAPPQIKPAFCADMRQSLTVNGTVTQDETMHLCMDTEALKWSRTTSDQQQQVFNGTDRFDLTPNATAKGGFNCQRTTFGVPKPDSLPFSMVVLDDGANYNRSEHFT